MDQEHVPANQLGDLEIERVILQQFYEHFNHTATAVRMQIEPPAAWISAAVVYGATRIDAINKDLFAKFPTWQHALEFHMYAREQEQNNVQVVEVFPLASPPPVTYEVFVEALKARYNQAGENVAKRTFIVEYD